MLAWRTSPFNVADALWRVGDAAAAVISPSCARRLTLPRLHFIRMRKLAADGMAVFLAWHRISSPPVAKLCFSSRRVSNPFQQRHYRPRPETISSVLSAQAYQGSESDLGDLQAHFGSFLGPLTLYEGLRGALSCIHYSALTESLCCGSFIALIQARSEYKTSVSTDG